ncbi:hypothetical protein M0R45_003119 [Rubus argutus]|uniref:Uncharacterized protein n=1 Tax=Rubus argutus TaxID=59490 RepID=A0AAW1YFI8_RUBAR
MGFFFGLVLGIIVGLALIVGFVKLENRRSKLRSQLAVTIAAFARMTVEDSRKLLPGDYYPSWLKWLNSHLEKMWPYVNEAASELIKASVEPILEQYTPVILSSMKFAKFTLGTVAPQFTGVSIVEGGADSVTMELEMQWDGNPSIILDINTLLGIGLPVQVKDIGFTGRKKNLDFKLKVVGGDISAIPGLQDQLEGTIRDAIEDSITWPVRKVIPILPGDYSDLELKTVGILENERSRTINNDLNPIWNEHFEFVVEDESTQHLVVKIYDDEGLQASELIGCAQIRLSELQPGKVKDVWLKLVKSLELQRDNKNRGQVHLELLYCPFGMENGFVNPFTPNFSMTSLEKVLKSGANGIDATENEKEATQKRKEVIIRGVLSVTLISADDLPPADLLGKADPYVVLTLKKSGTKNKTRVVNDSLNPVWNQTFDFVVEDGLHEMLILEVYDHDTFGKDHMGRCILTLTRVILEGEYNDSLPLDGAKSGRLNIHLKWMPQPIFRDS